MTYLHPNSRRKIAQWSVKEIPVTDWYPSIVTLPDLVGSEEKPEEKSAGSENEEPVSFSEDLCVTSWQLAACVVVVRWGEPGAHDLLSQQLREIGEGWRETTMWKRFAPAETSM